MFLSLLPCELAQLSWVRGNDTRQPGYIYILGGDIFPKRSHCQDKILIPFFSLFFAILKKSLFVLWNELWSRRNEFDWDFLFSCIKFLFLQFHAPLILCFNYGLDKKKCLNKELRNGVYVPSESMVIGSVPISTVARVLYISQLRLTVCQKRIVTMTNNKICILNSF